MKNKCILFASLIFSGAQTANSQVALNPTASRFLGQPSLTAGTINPNWIDGREFFYPQGIVVDTSTTPPSLYVSDTSNNRVMGWKSATGFTNGQPADLIIGQPDQYSTQPGGGSSTRSTGLSSPVGLAVLNGDLFVADTGNNRVLRYRAPLTHSTGNIVPDLWLGQPSLSSNTANYSGQLGAQGLKLSGAQSYLAFDPQGNLWVSDPGNNRVVRFPAASFSCSNCGSTGSNGAADAVLGQPNLTSSYATGLGNTAASAVIGNQFNVPGGLAFDSSGRLYVTDDGIPSIYPGRVLVFTPPFNPGGQSAARIMGVFSPSNPQPTQQQINATVMISPTAVFFFPDQSVGVTDSQSHRIIVFPPYSQWPDPGTSYSPQATTFFGQNNFMNRQSNGSTSMTAATPPPSAGTLADPTAVYYLAATNELYVTDTLNNRVVVLQVFPASDSLGNATRVLGQDSFSTSSINLLEGREFQFITFTASGSELVDAGIAIDSTGSTPHLYVSDPGNNRVLGYKDMRNLDMTKPADIVIGQPNGQTALCNYPTGDSAQPTQSSLCSPRGILVDSAGNLYVADSANGRVLRFPAPFANPTSLPQADLVLGQAGFFSTIKDPSANSMATPYGLAITGTNGLLVSDVSDNRVLYFKFTGNGTFKGGTDNGLTATKVFGQPNFTTITSGASSVNFNGPHHISTDSNGQLYVADTGNNRIEIFPDPSASTTLTSGQGAGLTLPTNAAEGVFVNQTTGEVWVANTKSSTAVRYPKYETLLFNQTPLDANPIQPLVTLNGQLSTAFTLAVAQDQFGDLVLADATNRISIFYPGLAYLNGASFALDKPYLAPGMIGTMYPLSGSNKFGSTTATNTNASQWPTTLGGIQILFNGKPVPLDYVSPTQINFLVPNGAPTSGTVSTQVVQTSTGQVLGAGVIQMQPVATGLFICDTSNGTLRQACVLNQDNSVNSGTNPAARGSVIQIFATGEGNVPNAPADGTPATGPTPAPANLRVYLGTAGFVDETPLLPGDPPNGQFVQYSGLAPGLVGVWQVNVQIPMGVAPGTQTILALILNGNVADPDASSPYRATVAIK